MPNSESMRLARPPGFIVLMKAAAPIKVGKTRGMGSTIRQIRLPKRSVRVVSHARVVPINAAVADTVRANESDRHNGSRMRRVAMSSRGSPPSVKFLHRR